MNIDLTLLKKQKLSLLAVITNRLANSKSKSVDKITNDLDGILHLLDAIQDEQEEPEIKYYLFGAHSSQQYHEMNSFDEFMSNPPTEFALYAHSKKQSLDEFLVEYDGWGGYAEITKEEYERLQDLQDEQ